MDPDKEIHFEYFPVIRVYKSGCVERFLTQIIPASTDPTTGVTSKDVVIDSSTGLWVRGRWQLEELERAIKSTDDANSADEDTRTHQRSRLMTRKSQIFHCLRYSGQKLLVVVNYHDGAFLTGSAVDQFSHNNLNRLVAEAKIVAFSVNYWLSKIFEKGTEKEDELIFFSDIRTLGCCVEICFDIV
ncbi:alpha/beta-Hydrolases superfamily protein [Rhynchospora pubera]|uniref:Alpha/beta-Hydrolases superfamily protein n=1 Tax=Rhynchospora pubera TaxID=906938 RepID=A0AAV8ELW3_9POAL|nr:alpha/beta-Hydrolases superfamily protein [Rhynchospora pubera]